MDVIVCGDFASISCGTWIAFWNGAIGAFVAAVLGGLVALVVVRLTNAHQSRLARRAREQQAAADMAAAFTAMRDWSDGAIADYYPHMLAARAASLRWRMDSIDHGLTDELRLWPYHVYILATEAEKARRGRDAAVGAAQLLYESVATFFEFAVACHSAKPSQLHEQLSLLRASRLRGEAAVPRPSKLPDPEK